VKAGLGRVSCRCESGETSECRHYNIGKPVSSVTFRLQPLVAGPRGFATGNLEGTGGTGKIFERSKEAVDAIVVELVTDFILDAV